jgi:hypothetical protein
MLFFLAHAGEGGPDGHSWEIMQAFIPGMLVGVNLRRDRD